MDSEQGSGRTSADASPSATGASPSPAGASPSPASAAETPMDRRRRLARRLATGLIGLVAFAAFLASGLLLLVGLALTPNPNPGSDFMLLIVKLTDIGGWLAIGIWLLRDWWQARFRVVVLGVVAWIWTYLFTGVLTIFGFLNIGY